MSAASTPVEATPAPRPRPTALSRAAVLVLALAAWWLVYSRLAAAAGWLTTIVLGLSRETALGSAVEFFLYEAPKVLMLLTLVVFGVGIVRSFFTAERTRRMLAGKHETAGSVLAALLGVVTPFCSCSAVPLFIGFVTTGVPLGVTFAFLVSAPMVNEIALALLFGLFGWKVAALYAGTGLVIAIVSGLVIGRLHLEGWVEAWVYQVKAGGPSLEEERLSWDDRLRLGREAVRDIVAKVWPYVWEGSRSAPASTATCRRTSWPLSWGGTPGGPCPSPCWSASRSTPTPRASSRSSRRCSARGRRSAQCWPS